MELDLKQLVKTVWSMTVLRIGIDASNRPFVDIQITETGEERRLYSGDTLNMNLNLKDES